MCKYIFFISDVIIKEILDHDNSQIEADSNEIEDEALRHDENSPFLPKHSALALLGNENAMRRRRRRSIDFGSQGIVCECCHHKCSFREMTQYCSSDHSSGGPFAKRSVPTETSDVIGSDEDDDVMDADTKSLLRVLLKPRRKK